MTGSTPPFRSSRNGRESCSSCSWAADLCRGPTEKGQAPNEWKEWIEAERQELGIDTVVGEWGTKPLLYHLKAKPHRFLPCMYAMSKAREEAGQAAFSLYPLRRSMVPKHARFDQKALRDLLRIGSSDHIKKLAKERSAKKRKASQMDGEKMELPRCKKTVLDWRSNRPQWERGEQKTR